MRRFKYCDLNPFVISSHLIPLCIYTLALASPLIHILVHFSGLFGAAMQSKVVAISMLVLKRVDLCFENYVSLSASIGNYKRAIGARMRILAWRKVPILQLLRIDISDGTKLPEAVAATETTSVRYTSFCKVNLLQSEQLICQRPHRVNPHPVRGPAHRLEFTFP